MRVAVFGRTISPVFYESLKRLFKILHLHGVEMTIYAPFADYLCRDLNCDPGCVGRFSSYDELKDIDFFFSIGGDGTFLEGVSFVRDSGIPMVGINSGRLGFLADIAQEELEDALENLFAGRYRLQPRSLIKLDDDYGMFGDFPFALNEITIYKHGSSQMITTHVQVGDEFLNSYWSDGIILATPTGSTAYSLSAGGPIITPEAANFTICPIAPHNLSVRPVIIPDYQDVTAKVESREGKFMASLDGRSVVFDAGIELKIRKADFRVNVLKLPNQSFYGTLRNKLMWGMDRRN